MKSIKFFLFLAGTFCLVGILLAACGSLTPIPPPTVTASKVPATLTPSNDTIQGKVVDVDGKPVPGAIVRIQATTNETRTDKNGNFILSNLEAGIPVTVSAWKQDHYCAMVEKVTPPASDVTLTLRPYQTNDNPAYEWIPPTGENSCYSCKPGVTQVWLDNDAHGRSAQNIRFLTMYNGTDVEGNQSPPTRFGTSRDYGSFPLRPDLSQPYFGPGYKLDFPETRRELRRLPCAGRSAGCSL